MGRAGKAFQLELSYNNIFRHGPVNRHRSMEITLHEQKRRRKRRKRLEVWNREEFFYPIRNSGHSLMAVRAAQQRSDMGGRLEENPRQAPYLAGDQTLRSVL